MFLLQNSFDSLPFWFVVKIFVLQLPARGIQYETFRLRIYAGSIESIPVGNIISATNITWAHFQILDTILVGELYLIQIVS